MYSISFSIELSVLASDLSYSFSSHSPESLKRVHSNFSDELENESKPKRKKVVDAGVCNALDRIGLSSKKGTFLIAAVIQSLGDDINDYNLSYSTIDRRRIENRKNMAA